LVIYDYPLPQATEIGASRHSPHIQELLSLRSKKIAKNIVIVEAPKKKGAHDDFADALVRSVWLSVEEMGGEKFVAGQGLHLPHAATSASLQAFQAVRARQHGVGPKQRPSAPGGGRRGMLRYAR
jgi:hypothetical protein